MRTQKIARKIARYAEALGFTVEQHGSGMSDSRYLTLWYASVLAFPLCIRISRHPATPAAIRKHGLADFEIGSHSAQCTDMAECVHWLRTIARRELPPKLAVSMQHKQHQAGSGTLITLYHFCGQADYKTLQQHGFINGVDGRTDRFLRDMDWQPYHWMAEQMECRHVQKPPNAGKFPVWAWHTHGGKQPPGLNCAGLGVKGERTVMLEIQLPADHVLLFDHEKWQIVLSNGPCAETEPEREQWNAMEKVWPAERYSTAMRASWEKIFDPVRQCAPECQGSPKRSCDYIQACFWVLEASMVRAERWFIAK